MVNFVQWRKNCYQIILEGASFYFLKKVCIAARPPRNNLFICRNPYRSNAEWQFINDLKLTCKQAIEKPKDEFIEIVNSIYKKAIFQGARRIAAQRMHQEIPLFEEEPFHVTYQEDYDCEIDNRDARNGGQRQTSNPFD